MWCATAFAILLVGSMQPAGADSQVHESGPGCGDTLATRVARNLPQGVDIGDDVDIDANLVRDDRGLWHLELEIVRGELVEPRSFVAEDCHAVMDAAAFAIAVAVDPRRRDEGGAQIPEPAPTEAPPPETPIAASKPETPAPSATDAIAPPPATSTSPRARRIGAYVGASGGLDVGALPRATGWFGANVGVRGAHWRAGLLGGFRLQTEARARNDGAAGGRFGLWSVGAQACGVPTRGVLEFPLCGGFEAGQLRVQGFGFDGAARLHRPWVAALVGPELLWRVNPRAAIGIGAQLGAPMLRTRVDIENLERLYTVGPVYVRALVRLEGRFP